MFRFFAAICLLIPLSGSICALPLVDDVSGWGVDACISRHAIPSQVDAFIALLRKANLTYVRERTPGGLDGSGKFEASALPVFQKLRASGLRVVAFYQLNGTVEAEQPGNQLPENLLAVYRSAREMAAMAGRDVDVWEMVGEADLGYCRDLPERVVAFQKAVYLGIKDGTQENEAGKNTSKIPGVLMGALGLPPGPWLHRAARNGLYDYTDGVNFHFYGHAEDLHGVIEAQRNAASLYAKGRTLPLWITECGMNAVPAGQPDNAHAREIQRDFTVETALIARREKVSVFMPFILVGRDGDGYSLTKSASQPYPAWTAYTRFTRKVSLPAGPVLAAPETPNRLVLQWLPDNSTCVPHKMSGVYWFDGDESGSFPMQGEVVAYNLSDRAVSGVIEAKVGVDIRMTKMPSLQKVKIPAFGSFRLPMNLAIRGVRYVRTEVEVVFRPDGGGSESNLVFGLESRPGDSLLPHRISVKARRPERGFAWIWSPERYRISSQGGPWLGVNGIKIGDGDAEIHAGALDRAWRFEVLKPQADPRLPPMTITRVDGLPDVPNAFLRLRTSEGGALAADIRVDLIDKHGQRFTNAENFGRNWTEPDQDVTFLSYRDFQLYGFGRCTASPIFRPADIREIQLRFFPKSPAKPLFVRLDVVASEPKKQP